MGHQRLFLFAFTALIFCNTEAQIKVGDNPNTINSNSAFEVESTDKGVLIPRINLVVTTSFAPLSAHVGGMIVYNTATTGDVTPGFYYNDGASWVRIVDEGAIVHDGDAWGTSGEDQLSSIGRKGDVGIGMSSPPDCKLHIANGGNASLSTNGYLMIGDSVTTNLTMDNNDIMVRKKGSAQPLSLQNQGGGLYIQQAAGAGIQSMFTAGGFLGIGTANPQSKVHAHNTTTANFIRLTHSTTSFTGGFSLGINGTGVSLWNAENGSIYFGTNNATRMYVGSTGNVSVGIGASPTLLTVQGAASKPGGGSWTVLSDEGLKKNVKPYNEGLSQVLQINPISFQYNGEGGVKDTESTYIGVIAQDMQKIAPHMVEEVEYRDESVIVNNPSASPDDAPVYNYLMYDPSALNYMLVNAVKELNEEIQALKSRVAELEVK